jgi:pimeloyl-ACP methyl ester carboxylesterase
MVAHSMSTFVAQKYLESFPLTALIMINPIPPDPSTAVRNLINQWELSEKLVGNQQQLQYYYGLDDCQTKIGHSSFTSQTEENQSLRKMGSLILLNSLMHDKSTAVSLENCSAPMFVIHSKGDNSVVGDLGLQSLLDYHGIDQEFVISLPELSRISMITSKKQFLDHLNTWVDMTT